MGARARADAPWGAVTALPADGVVVAGGESSRLGRDKALVEVGGRTLLEWATSSLEAVCRRVWLAGRDRERYDFVGLPPLPDAVPGAGPLAAVASALSLGRPVLVLACDLFPVTEGVWWELWRHSLDAGAAVADCHGPQPLLAVYHPSCRAAAEAELAGGRRMMAFVRAVGAALVPLPDPPVNVNTLQDLSEARRRYG
jgi:molybdopterin-guanine dinucleotide biosynthesis protein A